MAKPTKQDLQQALLEQIAQLTEKVSALEQKQQQESPVSRKREPGAARPEIYYVLLGVPSEGLPPQALACARILATAADTHHIPEAEAMALLEAGKKAGKLKTGQGSWHIFQYYRAKLIEGNYLRMLDVNNAPAPERSK